MSTTEIGSAFKKQTVYDGPDFELAPVRIAAPRAPMGVVGTIHSGPVTPAPATMAGTSGTVYDPARHRAMIDHAAVNAHVQRNNEVSKAGRIFYIIAALTTVNSILAAMSAGFVFSIGLGVTQVFDQQLRRGGDLGLVMLVNGAAVALFIILGIFAQHGSKGALFIGSAVYGSDMLLLFSDGVVQHAPSLLVHGLLLFGIFRAFRYLES